MGEVVGVVVDVELGVVVVEAEPEAAVVGLE